MKPLPLQWLRSRLQLLHLQVLLTG
jgi:hypothetical protein